MCSVCGPAATADPRNGPSQSCRPAAAEFVRRPAGGTSILPPRIPLAPVRLEAGVPMAGVDSGLHRQALGGRARPVARARSDRLSRPERRRHACACSGAGAAPRRRSSRQLSRLHLCNHPQRLQRLPPPLVRRDIRPQAQAFVCARDYARGGSICEKTFQGNAERVRDPAQDYQAGGIRVRHDHVLRSWVYKRTPRHKILCPISGDARQSLFTPSFENKMFMRCD